MEIILFINRIFWSLSKKFFSSSSSNHNNSFISKMSSLYMMPTVEPIVMRFNYEHFQQKNITQLMQCLWIYSDAHGKRCKTYRQWVIWSMKEKWSSSYINFDTVVYKLISRDQQYVYIMHIAAHFLLYLQQPLYPDCRCATCVTYKAELAVKHGKKTQYIKKKSAASTKSNNNSNNSNSNIN